MTLGSTQVIFHSIGNFLIIWIGGEFTGAYFNMLNNLHLLYILFYMYQISHNKGVLKEHM